MQQLTSSFLPSFLDFQRNSITAINVAHTQPPSRTTKTPPTFAMVNGFAPLLDTVTDWIFNYGLIINVGMSLLMSRKYVPDIVHPHIPPTNDASTVEVNLSPQTPKPRILSSI